MWVPVPEKIKTNRDNVASLVDSLRLIKAIKIDQPDLPIELTIEPLTKKTVNSNVLKGRYILPNPIPTPSSRENDGKKHEIAVILDESSAEDIKTAKQLGADHFGGQNLLDRILAEEIKPTKLLVHSRTPKIQNIFNNSENKKTLFKTLSKLNIMIPSEKRGTMSDDLRELILNSKSSIDWMLQKKTTIERPDPQQVPASNGHSKPQKVSKPNKNSNAQIDSFISIPVGSVQMSLTDLEHNISDFLSTVSNLTQFGNASSNSPTPTTPSTTPTTHTNLQPRINFKSGRPVKRPGIHKAILNAKGIPSIAIV